MLKLLAYFGEATVLLYFAQSVLVKISTNSLSAELRRGIIMAKREIYVEQNLNRKYTVHLAVLIVLNYTHILRDIRNKQVNTLGIMCQNKNAVMYCSNGGSWQYKNMCLWSESSTSAMISKAMPYKIRMCLLCHSQKECVNRNIYTVYFHFDHSLSITYKRNLMIVQYIKDNSTVKGNVSLEGSW